MRTINGCVAGSSGVCNNPLGPPGNLGGFVKTVNGEVLKNTQLILQGDKNETLMIPSSGNYMFSGMERGIIWF
ncbi:MAG: hypothetical protein R2784_01480 [Saprospiraceae bacterium]